MQASTIVIATVGTATLGLLAYAVYFDHRRRTDVNFRKQLKRDSRRLARAAREEAEERGAKQREHIKSLVDEAMAAEYPKDVEEKEAMFLSEVGRGEALCQEGSDSVEAALCFYKALKVYPQPRDLIGIYDRIVPKPVLDILAEMIAHDPSISVSFGKGPASESGGSAGSWGGAVE
ncbi:MAG: hypothetical protein M1829_003141 [Trizodia sp. TS-e1964]|nr:MAG: hypothetical protein M1829_003141 [Trizodia sp. TS-e1964]